MYRLATRRCAGLKPRQQVRYDSHAASAGAPAEEFPVERFSSVLWPISAVAGVVAFLVYRSSLKANATATDPLHKTEDGFPAEAEDASKPWLTRYIAYHTPDPKLTRQSHEAALVMALKGAENRNLFERAELPRLRHRRYPQSFEQASPHCIPVGSQTDLSGLEITTSTRPNLPVQHEEHH